MNLLTNEGNPNALKILIGSKLGNQLITINVVKTGGK